MVDIREISIGEAVRNLNASILGDTLDGSQCAGDSKRPSKYRNVKRKALGRVFDSGKEAARAQELQLLEKEGQIFNLGYQVRFPLAGGIVYVCDFCYSMVLETCDDRLVTVVEDVKSEITRKLPTYRMKRKLFRDRYGIDITEV